MASYSIENDSVGGYGGLGGFGGGFGGGCGLLVVLLILFAVFSGGGLFGRREHDHDDWHRDFFAGKFSDCCGTSNCQIDKDVLTARDAGIIEQNKIYEKELEQKINEQNMMIMEQKNQLFLNCQFSELKEQLGAKFSHIEHELCKKPDAVPHWCATVDACNQRQFTCLDRVDDRRNGHDRDDRCGCWC